MLLLLFVSVVVITITVTTGLRSKHNNLVRNSHNYNLKSDNSLIGSSSYNNYFDKNNLNTIPSLINTKDIINLANNIDISNSYNDANHDNSASNSIVSKNSDSNMNNFVSTNSYEIIEELSSEKKHIWWDLFNDNSVKKSELPVKVNNLKLKLRLSKDANKDTSFLPNFGAWRAIDKEDVTILSTPPGSLKDYLNGNYELDDTHYSKILDLWNSIKTRGSMRHLSEKDSSLVVEAIKIAYVALWGKRTMRSLEVVINRARGIASVLGELNADVDVVLAGILHEVVSELQTTNEYVLLEELTANFGKDIIDLAVSYARLPKFMARKADYTPLQSENQLQMLVVSTQDYRELYIRLADRLHTMRVLRSLPLDNTEREKIAQEALHVYSALAHRMGVMKVKGELEDLAFRVLHPEVFRQTRYTQIAANKAYQEAHDKIQEIMSNDGIFKAQKVSFRLTYRIKDKYQLFLKMHRKGLKSLNDVRDALGLRIIVDVAKKDDEDEEAHRLRGNNICFYLIERLRNMEGWEPSKNGFKDYITFKKENGYESLHQYIRNTALGTNVEVQVRTKAMHIKAELGEAAHWFYKDQIYKPEIANSKTYKQAWRSTEQLSAKTSAELIGIAKMNLKSSRIFLYLEDKSTVLNLRKGATALDAAFHIHTELGKMTESILVNGETKPLDYEVQCKDVISVRRTENGSLSVAPSWFGILKTTSALSTLRKHYKTYDKGALISVGLAQLLYSLSVNKDIISKRHNDGLPTIDRLVKMIKFRTGLTVSEFLANLGSVLKEDALFMISQIFDVPSRDLKVSSLGVSLTWAKMQGQYGWEDEDVKQNYILPILRDVLKVEGLLTAEQDWLQVIGINSLGNEQVAIQAARNTAESIIAQINAVQPKRIPFSDFSVASLTRTMPTRSLRPRSKKSSAIAMARTPYSLVANQIPAPLLRLARKNYASMIASRRNNNVNNVIGNVNNEMLDRNLNDNVKTVEM